MMATPLIYPNIDPVLFHLGPLAIRWYALAYICGLLAGYGLILKMLQQRSLWRNDPFRGIQPATAEQIGDLFVWTMLGVIVGGRVGFDLFYGIFYCGFWNGRDCGNLPWGYLENPLRLLADWHNGIPQLRGMSFHGGLIGVAVAIVWFCRRNKLRILAIGDLIASVAPIGLFFGRIANFINGELWGKVTDSPIGMIFCNETIRGTYGFCPAGTLPRYPSQLIEAMMEGVILFSVLQTGIRVFRWQEKPGLTAGIFFFGYGTARIASEFFRDSESMIYGWFSMGMALSLFMWAVGGYLIWYAVAKPQRTNQ